MPIVETCDLVKTYKMGDTYRARAGWVEYANQRGEFMAIMGRSERESTLLNMLGCRHV